MICGRLISTHVSLTIPETQFTKFISPVRNKAAWDLIKPSNDEGPPRRTGHTCVSCGDRIIMLVNKRVSRAVLISFAPRFGGTDQKYHYNDTWSYDTTTQQWTELNCIGFIPSPREGHAAALVNDVIYVFGGRGVDGSDLGDLAAFKISSMLHHSTHRVYSLISLLDQRWYMFQNMGPAPSVRSGHRMASVGTRVFVLGGESSVPGQTDDSSIMHVLDTSQLWYILQRLRKLTKFLEHIKYPEPAKPSPPEAQGNNSARRPSVTAQASQSPSQQQQSIANGAAVRAMSPNARPQVGADEARRAMSPPGTRPNVTNKTPNGSAAPAPAAPAVRGPPRDRREGDGVYGSSEEGSESTAETARARMTSPDNGRTRSPEPSGTLSRSVSPQMQMQGDAYQPMVNGLTGASQQQQQPMNMASLTMQRNAQRARSPSPVVDRPKPAVDNTYASGGRSSPAVNGYAPGPRPGSTGNVTADLIRDLKIKEAELEEMKKRETWMRAALRSATNAGFAYADVGANEVNRRSPIDEEPDVKGLANMIMHVKQEHARVQVSSNLSLFIIVLTYPGLLRVSLLIKFMVHQSAVMKWSG